MRGPRLVVADDDGRPLGEAVLDLEAATSTDHELIVPVVFVPCDETLEELTR